MPATVDEIHRLVDNLDKTATQTHRDVGALDAKLGDALSRIDKLEQCVADMHMADQIAEAEKRGRDAALAELGSGSATPVATPAVQSPNPPSQIVAPPDDSAAIGRLVKRLLRWLIGGLLAMGGIGGGIELAGDDDAAAQNGNGAKARAAQVAKDNAAGARRSARPSHADTRDDHRHRATGAASGATRVGADGG